MGSNHHQGVILVLDDKLDCFGSIRKLFYLVKKGLAFCPRPVPPPRADGSSLGLSWVALSKSSKIWTLGTLREDILKVFSLARADVVRGHEVVAVAARVHAARVEAGHIGVSEAAFLGQDPGEVDVFEVEQRSLQWRHQKTFGHPCWKNVAERKEFRLG